MDSSPNQTFIVPVSLGEASSFNRAIFPLLSYRRRDSLGQGDLYLDGTIDELLKIRKIGTDPEQLEELIATTKARYDALMLEKSELEGRPKSKNPLKKFANYRAARMFLAASKSLFHATKSRSEEMVRTIGRGLLSVPNEDVQPVESDVPPGSTLLGIAVRLEHPLDDTTKQQLLDIPYTMASFAATHEGDQTVSDASSFLTEDYVLASESLASLVSSDTGDTSDDALSPST